VLLRARNVRETDVNEFDALVLDELGDLFGP
jgi:hypothetical protein